MASTLSVSVDLDELAHYCEIHGLGDDGPARSRAIWTIAVPRALDLFRELDIPVTFFVIGRSLDTDIGAPAAERLVGEGHEVANHSFSHYYDLLRRGPAQRRDELERGAAVIEAVTGARPRGFRAPGYNIDDAMLGLLREQGYVYDSSVFPCPPYYAAKAAAMIAIRARGRESGSVLGPKEVLLAPTDPYFPGEAFWKPRRTGFFRRRSSPRGLIELPITTLPGVRTPFIGTALALAGPKASAVMARAAAMRRHVSLELHGIDFLDAEDDELEPLARHQPDLKVPLDRKIASYRAAITTLLRHGARPLTCLDLARRLTTARQ